jgi:hypothetical protein
MRTMQIWQGELTTLLLELLALLGAAVAMVAEGSRYPRGRK